MTLHSFPIRVFEKHLWGIVGRYFPIIKEIKTLGDQNKFNTWILNNVRFKYGEGILTLFEILVIKHILLNMYITKEHGGSHDCLAL